MVLHGVNGAPKSRKEMWVAAGLQLHLVKVKFTLEQATNVRTGSRGIVLLVH
jgi:hypothetical protein